MIDEQINDVEELFPSENKFMKRRENGLMLSDEDIKILEEYHIDYLKYKTLEELILEITKVLNETSDDAILLEELNIKLGEYNYYNYTNK